MGDRFYNQQNEYLGRTRANKSAPKPKRKLKKDYVAQVAEILGEEVPGLDKLTIASLEALIDAIQRTKNDN